LSSHSFAHLVVMNNITENLERSQALQRLKQQQRRCYEREALQRDMRRIARHESSKDVILMLALVGAYVLGVHFDLGWWGFVIVIVATFGLLHWDGKIEDALPGIKLEGVTNMASNYALLISLKKHQDTGPVTWSLTNVDGIPPNQ